MSLMTKKELAASLKRLMQKTSLDRITVKDVVSDCGVNRQTFYYHFQDIYDLLGWIYRTEAVDGIADCKTYETWPKGFLKIFQYVAENRVFCLNTFHSLGREHLDRFLHEVTFDLLIGVVNEVAQGSGVSDKEKNFIANFYTAAFIGLMTGWIQGGMEDDPAQIIDDLNKLIEGDIARAIAKYTQK